MSESKFKKAQGSKIPGEFICPISQTIMRDPVFNDEGTTFDRKVIEQWIDKHGTDPLTRKPLSKKDLKPNRALRESLSKKQKEQLQHMNVYQIAKIREKELEDMKYSTPQPKKDGQKLQRQLEIVKNQLSIQRQQKELAIRQCNIQKKQAAIVWERQMVQMKERNLMFEQKIKESEQQNQVLKERNLMFEQKIKENEKENQVLNKENLELRQLQKRHCQQIEELEKMLKDCRCGKQKHEQAINALYQSVKQLKKIEILIIYYQQIISSFFNNYRNVCNALHEKLVPRSRNAKITPDKQSRGFKDGNWVIDNTNSNVCIKNMKGNNWLCSSALPFDGEFVFTIKVIQLTRDCFNISRIWVGVMEEEKKGEKGRDTLKYSVFLNPYDQYIRRPNEEQTRQQFTKCSCSNQLPKCPFYIDCHVNRQQNTIAWRYDGKQQAKSILPKAWKTNKKQLCAVVWVYQKGDSVEMMRNDWNMKE